jgi:hypothetical protein
MKTTATATRRSNQGTSVRRLVAPTPIRRQQHRSDDVRELIEAAGPLDVCDIADGLEWTVGEAQTFVSSLVSDGHLQQDEWDRFRLAGDWR